MPQINIRGLPVYYTGIESTSKCLTRKHPFNLRLTWENTTEVKHLQHSATTALNTSWYFSKVCIKLLIQILGRKEIISIPTLLWFSNIPWPWPCTMWSFMKYLISSNELWPRYNFTWMDRQMNRLTDKVIHTCLPKTKVNKV